VGLVTRDEFVEKRQTIADRVEADAKRQRAVADEAAWQERDRQRAKRVKAEQKHKLSFDDEDEEQEEEQEAGDAGEQAGAAAAAAAAAPRRFATLGKDPSIRSDFLPDRDREREEEELRATLKGEWALRQAALRAEPLDITYSYWNGSGHRRTVTVRKGDSVAAFLKAVQEQLAPAFREIRTAGVSGLMYVKEDIVLPHSVTFYDLIAARAQGKSGPLFTFDLAQHAAAAFDPRLKAQDSHAGKVVERHWYNRHKHIFPYSRWEVYDPEVHAEGAQGGDAS
jgi:protein FAM50